MSAAIHVSYRITISADGIDSDSEKIFLILLERNLRACVAATQESFKHSTMISRS